MGREKQIEEMTKVIEQSGMLDNYSRCEVVATELYNAGYRKQSEGEWTKEVTDMWHCSVCLHPCLLNGGGDYTLSNFCPNCGAKMKGGAE